MNKETPSDKIIFYEAADGGVQVEVQLDRDTVWLTRDQKSGIFGCERSVIAKYILNVFRDGELDPGATCAKFAQVQMEGGRTVDREVDHYNLVPPQCVAHDLSERQRRAGG